MPRYRSRKRARRASNDWRIPAVAAACFLLLGLLVVPLLLGEPPLYGAVGSPLAYVFVVLSVICLIFTQRAWRRARKARPVSIPAAFTESYRVDGHRVKRPAEWSVDVLRRVEWKRLVDLAVAFYGEMGVTATTTPLGPEGGVDLRLYQDPSDPQRPTAVVMCKAWNRQVSARSIRDLVETLSHEAVQKAFVMAPAGFSSEAIALARDHGIVLIDGKILLDMIERLPGEASARLLALATEGDWTTPTCPKCGQKMVIRMGASGGHWGCKRYPDCKGMIPLRAAA